MTAPEDRPPARAGLIRRAADWRSMIRGDPVTYVVGVVALVVYALHGFDGRLSRDLGVYAYAGQQVADGVPPYEGIMNRAGPLAHLVPAVGVGFARIGGFDEVLGMRLVFLAISVACVCLVYVLARKLFASRLAGLAASAAFLTFAGFIEYASNGPREKTVMVLFLLCSLLAMAHRRWFAAGVSLCLATLTWQPVLFVGLAAIAVTLVAERHDRPIRALGRLTAGLAVPAVVCLAYFVSVGALGSFIDGYLLVNVGYTEPSPFWARPRSKWMRVEEAYGVSSWVLVAGYVALMAVALRALVEGRRREPASISVIAVGVAGIVSVAWTLRNFNGWPDAFLLLPFAAIGIGGVAGAVEDYVRPRTAVLLTSTWVVVAVAMALTYAIGERSHGLDRQSDEVAMILKEIPDASFQSIEAPQPLVLSGRTNPTRYQMFTDGMDRWVDDNWPGGLPGFTDWIARESPTILAIGRHGVPSWLFRTIRREYWYAGKAKGWTCYVNRSVDPAIVSDIRTQLKRRPPAG